MKTFNSAKTDRLTKLTTVLFLLLLSGIAAAAWYDQEINSTFFILILLGGFALASVGYFMIPTLSVSENKLYIKNRLGTTAITAKEIKGAKRYPDISLHFRLFGIAGVFGHFGIFDAGDRWFVTNIYKKVKIQTSQGRYIVSPENPEEFLREIQALRSEGIKSQYSVH